MSSKSDIEKALGRHRAEDHLPISIDMPLTYQLDLTFSAAIMNDLNYECSPWVRAIATKQLTKSLPEKPGLYVFAFGPNMEIQFETGQNHRPLTVLYIGQAGADGGNLRQRYAGEYQKYVGEDPAILWKEFDGLPKRTDLLKRYLTIYPLEFWYTTSTSVSALLDLEKRMVHLLNPPLNMRLKPRLRKGRTTPAFKEQ